MQMYTMNNDEYMLPMECYPFFFRYVVSYFCIHNPQKYTIIIFTKMTCDINHVT